jgi:putative phage-type endonuclease
VTAASAPTGVLLGTFQPGTPEWKAARAGLCITATEIAAVLGLSPWMSRFTLWHKKAGLPHAPFTATPEMEWGVRLEPAVALKWADEHQDFGVEATGTWQHTEREWQRATPDRLLTQRARTTALLEVKTSPVGDEWGPSGSDEIPVHYRCQVQWQMDVLGLQVCHVALLVGGCDYREYVVEYDETEAKVMRGAAERFLDDVRQGNRPPSTAPRHLPDDPRSSRRPRRPRRRDPAGHVAAGTIAYQAWPRPPPNSCRPRRSPRLIGNGQVGRLRRPPHRLPHRQPDGTTHALQPVPSKDAA